jgi:hypothetical protein
MCLQNLQVMLFSIKSAPAGADCDTSIREPSTTSILVSVGCRSLSDMVNLACKSYNSPLRNSSFKPMSKSMIEAMHLAEVHLLAFVPARVEHGA